MAKSPARVYLIGPMNIVRRENILELLLFKIGKRNQIFFRYNNGLVKIYVSWYKKNDYFFIIIDILELFYSHANKIIIVHKNTIMMCSS